MTLDPGGSDFWGKVTHGPQSQGDAHFSTSQPSARRTRGIEQVHTVQAQYVATMPPFKDEHILVSCMPSTSTPPYNDVHGKTLTKCSSLLRARKLPLRNSASPSPSHRQNGGFLRACSPLKSQGNGRQQRYAKNPRRALPTAPPTVATLNLVTMLKCQMQSL
jgi:hypothetical protein